MPDQTGRLGADELAGIRGGTGMIRSIRAEAGGAPHGLPDFESVLMKAVLSDRADMDAGHDDHAPAGQALISAIEGRLDDLTAEAHVASAAITEINAQHKIVAELKKDFASGQRLDLAKYDDSRSLQVMSPLKAHNWEMGAALKGTLTEAQHRVLSAAMNGYADHLDKMAGAEMKRLDDIMLKQEQARELLKIVSARSGDASVSNQS